MISRRNLLKAVFAAPFAAVAAAVVVKEVKDNYTASSLDAADRGVGYGINTNKIPEWNNHTSVYDASDYREAMYHWHCNSQKRNSFFNAYEGSTYGGHDIPYQTRLA